MIWPYLFTQQGQTMTQTKEQGASISTKKNTNLHMARTAKNDEFYTRIEDIENELKHYAKHLKGKVVFCNCDDPEWSNFWKHFYAKFDDYGLKRLITTHYTQQEEGGISTILECVDITRNPDGAPMIKKYNLKGDGDFRSEECVGLLEQSDIVITNPPFSLFREFVGLLMEKKKKFLVIGNMNAITYKEVFKHIKDNQIWMGITSPKRFYLPLPNERRPGKEFKKFGNICWFTNLIHKRRNEPLILFREYKDHEKEYPNYDNYAAIEVSRTENIPVDYIGVMGVPISFLVKHNPEQFEVIGMSANGIVPEEMKLTHFKKHNEPYISSKKIYQRLFIKRRPT